MKRSVLAISSFCLIASTLGFGIACEQSQAAPDPDGAQKPPVNADAQTKVDDANYVAEIKPVGSYKAGEAGTVEVTLKPKGGFKINEKFPSKLKLHEAEGISYDKAVLRKEDGKFSPKEGTFTVKFTPAKAGKAKVAGKLSMSVCSDERCLMEKVELAVDIDVK